METIMTKRYPRGSEWRKWDLHVHVPGTALSDGYDKKDGELDWDRAAEIIENSDVQVLGITDYFSTKNTIDFIKYYKTKYPKSEKVLLVNVELRLNESVNASTDLVHFHVVFRDSVAENKIYEFLQKLPTQITDTSRRKKSCAELSGSDKNTATVTRDDIKNAFRDTFGSKTEATEHLIFLAPANNDGMRTQRGHQRKANLTDEIDKDIHAVFGKDPSNAEYFLKIDRYEDKTQTSRPKPVFGGCDAHNFTDLEGWLGKAIEADNTRQVVTWVKGDPTFEGLQQTLVEPSNRVSISELEPDAKDKYKVIRRVTFSGSTDFPDEIVFNPNLNTIIGSRSSGKSALLAHISHSIDPDYTIQQQMIAGGNKTQEKDLGPASGLSWREVEGTTCSVEWADGSSGEGRAIYIPQNWLYQISDNPKEVTNKIQPVLISRYATYFREHGRQLGAVKSANATIDKAVERWFKIADSLSELNVEVKDLGSKKSITEARDSIGKEIVDLRAANSLSEADLEKYQAVTHDIDANTARLDDINIEAEELSGYVLTDAKNGFSIVPNVVSAEIYLTPRIEGVPEKLREVLLALITKYETTLVGQVETAIVAYKNALSAEDDTLKKASKRLQDDNKALIEKHKANATLNELVMRQKTQQLALEKIEKLEERRTELQGKQKEEAEEVSTQIGARSKALSALRTSFFSEIRSLDQLTFGIAVGFDVETIRFLSQPFKKNETGAYLKTEADEQLVDVEKCQGDPQIFMEQIFSKNQKLNQGHVPVDVAKRILGATAEVRFTAELESDSIGGFERSTMTPGKRALFALTLILGESEDQWTLLIDQPEDDLDSRSIYDEIVTYLVDQKKQRQIILVTHNANLVVGADAEEIVVANRHGDDRKNRDNLTFDYLTGSLEHSSPKKAATFDLDQMGIREHAVEILDGGEEAFQKRRDKYKI
jgi:energy-coupling factor transporter ATP-binding protein EcfA2